MWGIGNSRSPNPLFFFMTTNPPTLFVLVEQKKSLWPPLSLPPHHPSVINERSLNRLVSNDADVHGQNYRYETEGNKTKENEVKFALTPPIALEVHSETTLSFHS